MADVSDYTPEILEKAKAYLEKEVVFPSVADLAIHLGKARSTLYKWAKESDKKEFSDILETVLAVQEKLLIERGLTSDYNSTITKLMLTKHGYSDKQETDVTTGGKTLTSLLGGESVQKDNSNRKDTSVKE